jgi:polyisoprenyl-phosphate glycosyltransferase
MTDPITTDPITTDPITTESMTAAPMNAIATGDALAAAPHAPRRQLISVVIPVFNEENNVRRAYAEVCQVFDEIGRYDVEILFTDNHSVDRTPQILAELAGSDRRVKVVRFARNFGFQNSILTGYRLAAGDAAFQLDCDLQDPPRTFPAFLDLWEKGHDVVVGVRRKRQESPLIQLGRKVYYRLIQRFSDDNLIPDGGDFRLVDRSVLDELRRIHEAYPYTRGLISSLAKRQIGVPVDRDKRQFDQSKFPLKRMLGLAMDGFFAHSLMPLRLASYFGFIMAIGLFLMAIGYAIARLLVGSDWPSGFASLAVLIAFGASINAIFIGVIGEYVGRIYGQVRLRPNAVIESTINLDRPPAGNPVTLATVRPTTDLNVR